jgi:hypothetical protein
MYRSKRRGNDDWGLQEGALTATRGHSPSFEYNLDKLSIKFIFVLYQCILSLLLINSH